MTLCGQNVDPLLPLSLLFFSPLPPGGPHPSLSLSSLTSLLHLILPTSFDAANNIRAAVGSQPVSSPPPFSTPREAAHFQADVPPQRATQLCFRRRRPALEVMRISIPPIEARTPCSRPLQIGEHIKRHRHILDLLTSNVGSSEQYTAPPRQHGKYLGKAHWQILPATNRSFRTLSKARVLSDFRVAGSRGELNTFKRESAS